MVSVNRYIVPKNNLFPTRNSYKYQYHFENNILKAVESGSKHLFKETVEQCSNSIVPIISGDELRFEKNYFIIVYDPLSSYQ